MSTITVIDSIHALHARLGDAKPKHPLLTVLDLAQLPQPTQASAVRLGLYGIVSKQFDGVLGYGRGQYDFQEGTLFFTAPNQVLTTSAEVHIQEGWGVYFHPDLLRGTELGRKIEQYQFFYYDSHEALHVSDDENRLLRQCVDQLRRECALPIDAHTQGVLVSQLELLLQYCNRFYARQFMTRANVHTDLLQQFELLLKSYFTGDTLAAHGLPSVAYLADKLRVSPAYLTDLLHKTTGKTTQEYIHLELVERAKTLLWGTDKRVSEIAYALGFAYPSHFTKLFKNKTGQSPRDFRQGP
jgi:AraC family transcriptional activator of pobA